MFKKVIVCFFILITSISFLCFSSISKNFSSLSVPIKSHYVVTSNYGNRYLKEYDSHHFHNGMDLASSVGTPVYALGFGTVVFQGFYGSYGNTIIISYLNGYKSLYAHMNSVFVVSIGQSVTKDTVVGYIGPKRLSGGRLNGRTTGPHLHFSLYYKNKIIDPAFVFK